VENSVADSEVGGRPEAVLGKENMPGVIMESSRNGAHTNHDRDTMMNGINVETTLMERHHDRGHGQEELQHPLKQSITANGLNGAPPEIVSTKLENGIDRMPSDMEEHLQQLPPEIRHITEGFEPLSKLLTRLAQTTHNRLSAKILELASIHNPPAAVNGNGPHYSNGTAGNNALEILQKKVNLLKFAEDTHADWTKALVITHWSRVSENVSKLIDLKLHIDSERNLYDTALYQMSEVKRNLMFARAPNPDLKTAVEVLSTGKASWMPDVCSRLGT
jgi:mediator of RNA polymerase II transcription subunit 14